MSFFPLKKVRTGTRTITSTAAGTAVDELLREWGDDYNTDWKKWINSTSGSTIPLKKPVHVPPPDPIESATDDALILELIRRGFAVGKLNDKNQLDV